jgi:hypothetical protein
MELKMRICSALFVRATHIFNRPLHARNAQKYTAVYVLVS